MTVSIPPQPPWRVIALGCAVHRRSDALPALGYGTRGRALGRQESGVRVHPVTFAQSQALPASAHPASPQGPPPHPPVGEKLVSSRPRLGSPLTAPSGPRPHLTCAGRRPCSRANARSHSCRRARTVASRSMAVGATVRESPAATVTSWAQPMGAGSGRRRPGSQFAGPSRGGACFRHRSAPRCCAALGSAGGGVGGPGGGSV